jgi:hypothetical protein
MIAGIMMTMTSEEQQVPVLQVQLEHSTGTPFILYRDHWHQHQHEQLCVFGCLCSPLKKNTALTQLGSNLKL